MVSDQVVQAALFPMADLLPPREGHPDRLLAVAGTRLVLGGGTPHGLVFPEQLPDGGVSLVLRDVRELLRSEGRRTGVWFVPEDIRPTSLAAQLQELGLYPNDTPPFEPRYAAMAAIEPPPAGPTNVTVHRVRDIEELREAEQVASLAFGLDSATGDAYRTRAELVWQFESSHGTGATFVATIDGEIAGFAKASFGRSAVYLRGSGTHPDYRGRGIYRSLVRARWDAAVARGTPALTVGAGAMSRPILAQLGFSIYGWADCLRDELNA